MRGVGGVVDAVVIWGMGCGMGLKMVSENGVRDNADACPESGADTAAIPICVIHVQR